MAGDWIKFDTDTPDKEEVALIASILNIDPDAVVGKLLRVWTWFDRHTEEGNARSVTKITLDRNVGVSGFCDAMVESGWMDEADGWIRLSNFGRHNGKTAKNRALTAKRVAEHKGKKRDSNANGNETGNASDVTDALPREEKNREDKKNTPLKSPLGAGSLKDRFDRFWQAYPNRVGKGAAEKAFAKIKPDDLLTEKIIRSILAQDEFRNAKLAAGQFHPEWKNPSTWLNQRCWEDELAPLPVTGGRHEIRQPTGQPLSAVDRVRLERERRFGIEPHAEGEIIDVN